jgi:hypothetical protein
MSQSQTSLLLYVFGQLGLEKVPLLALITLLHTGRFVGMLTGGQVVGG